MPAGGREGGFCNLRAGLVNINHVAPSSPGTELAMTHTFDQELPARAHYSSNFSALLRRLPRILATTGLVMAASFATIEMLPRQFEARLRMDVDVGAQEPADLLAPEQLGDIVSRLAPQTIAELRQGDGRPPGITEVLRQRLTVRALPTGLELLATASTAAHAQALAVAAASSFMARAEPVPPPMPAKPEAGEPAAEPPPSTSPLSNDDIQLLRQRLSLAWEDRVRLESRAERIEALVAEGNLSMLALDAEGMPGLGRRLDRLAEFEAEAERLAVTLLPNHPNMRVLLEQIEQLNAELTADVENLVELVKAERDAARRLEEELRGQLASATAVVAVDGTAVTGAIETDFAPVVTALPRPIRTDLATALAGSLAFFGQLGFFALTRSRRAVEEDTVALDEPEPQAAEEDAPEQEPAKWLAGVDAGSIDASHSEPIPMPVEPAAEKLRASATVRIVAVQMAAGAGMRDVLARYKSQGKRVVLVDAASRRRGRVPGISDLSQGRASFADIIHGSGLYEAALIPWGTAAELDPNARSVRILIGALAELYDLVILLLDRDQPLANVPLLALADITAEAESLAKAA